MADIEEEFDYSSKSTKQAVRQVRIFEGLEYGVEKMVNKWLVDNAEKVEILQLMQSAAAANSSVMGEEEMLVFVVITIVYRKV